MSQMANNLRERESNNLQGSHAHSWTKWVRAIVPNEEEQFQERESGHIGYMRTNMTDAFDKGTLEKCGIYEWQAEGTPVHQPNYVVYVGSTCRGKKGALKQRIQEYCKKGSHKRNLINKALNKGYELKVRVKTSALNTKEDAQDMENKLLKNYDYAWNKRLNGKIRNIPP